MSDNENHMLSASLPALLQPYENQITQLQAAGRNFWERGWSLGTSSNYSAIINRDPLQLLLTASGKDKGNLQKHDFVIVDQEGKPAPADQPKSSAETLLHCVAAETPWVGSILHTHSVWSTILSERFAGQGGIEISGFEMLKGFRGITTHEARVWIPIFDNTQDIPSLAEKVRAAMQPGPRSITVGYLIRRHGMYTWGENVAEAVRHVEVMEFLLECMGRSIQLN